MSWITPLGFLGLIGILVLILIYILKPNYQQKFISSTFVWELSLKYKKKKIPINKFRNILIFICQVLVITACASLLAQPIIEETLAPTVIDKVAIIDASAGMRTTNGDKTRFERAIAEVKEMAGDVFEEDGYVTVIVAGAKASYIAQRVSAEDAIDLYGTLDEMAATMKDKDVANDACSYATADVKGAVELAQKIVDANDEAEVVMYTGTDYIDSGAVEVVNVSEYGEWNAAILDAKAVLEENYYSVEVSVASYNKAKQLIVHCDIKGASGSKDLKVEKIVTCPADEPQKLSFEAGNLELTEYTSIHVYISEADSFALDNDFYIYGGVKPELNILYCSTRANSFFGGMMMSIRDTLSSRWTINFKEINREMEEDLPTIGYDFYVFEHTMPKVMPKDGVVLLVNMDEVPEGLTVIPGKEVNGEFGLATATDHPLLTRTTFTNAIVTKYTKLAAYDGFEPLLYCAGDPVLLVKETEEEKVVLMSFSVNRSDISLLVDFPILFYNMFEYFIPSTLTEYSFDVQDEIKLNARSKSLKVESINGFTQTLESFPSKLMLTVPGSYTVKQTPMSGMEVSESFFVRIPESESNIARVEESMHELIVPKKNSTANLDLLIYFAAALVALLFLERFLHNQEM